uniref:60S ribosomal protein L7a n=1 Tax=Mustela putorius furo TaxID=9669 RepID=M3YDB9_MUSPF
QPSTMQKGKKAKGKKVARGPVVKKREAKKAIDPPMNFGSGQDIQPRDLTCFVKWPRHMGLWQQRAILYKPFKMSPSINQFTQALGHQPLSCLMAHKYRSETQQEKKQRLLQQAEKKAAGKGDVLTKASCPSSRVNTVITLAENKKPQLVVTTHNVDPTELVVLPTVLLCKMGVPYGIITGKARLEHLVAGKTCTTVAFTQVNSENKGVLVKLQEDVWTNDSDRYEIPHHRGRQYLGLKWVVHFAKLKKATKELATKPG